MAGTKAAGGGARGHGGAPAVDTPVWQPPPAESKIRESGAGVLKYRGDWGAYGGEMYNGPFVDGHEHGEAQWIVPTNLSGGRMVRRGTWVKGIRKNWVSYPVSAAQTKAFVDAFANPKHFTSIQAEMIADGFPHLPDGIDNTDPAVKMIVGGILRAQRDTAGEALMVQTKLDLDAAHGERVALEYEVEELQDEFNMGQDELHAYLDDIDEKRETIKSKKLDIRALNQQVEMHWRSDKMGLRERYLRAVERLNAYDIKDWHHIRGMNEQRGPVRLVLEAMCICVGLKPTFHNAIVLLNDRDINVKKHDRESIVLDYDVKIKDYINRGRFTFYQLAKLSKLEGEAWRCSYFSFLFTFVCVCVLCVSFCRC